MTFGEVKSIIEESLIESYKDQKNFKKVMNEFHQNVLTNKSISKLYSLYDDLTSEKGMSESDAKEYLEEGVKLIQTILSSSKLPKSSSKSINNKYSDLDTIVYTKTLNISERIQSKKNLVDTLKRSPNKVNESINIPLKSMVSVANQTLKSYIDTMDETSKKDFLKVIKGNPKELETEFTTIKESAITKLQTILEGESEVDLKTKISETIDKIKGEEFNQMNFVRISSLEKSI
jgi:polyhydroxyalkanoate synthesis regulator phasin